MGFCYKHTEYLIAGVLLAGDIIRTVNGCGVVATKIKVKKQGGQYKLQVG